MTQNRARSVAESFTEGFAGPTEADRERLAPDDVFAAGMRNHHISNTAYPIAHNTTWWPYRVTRDRYDDVVARAWAGVDELCLYAHVPFCEVRCSYCEYTVVGRDELGETEAYMDRLERELSLVVERAGVRGKKLRGFDIGGGTPAFVDAKRIARLVEQVHASFALADDYGISIETTPKIAAAEPAKLATYKAAGIDRISMGIQVVDADLLRALSREDNNASAIGAAVDNIRTAGFTRLNVDLMYGFADQSMESWRATLEYALALAPEYITLYRMRYKLTRISHQASRVQHHDVVEKAALAKEMLTARGYRARIGKNTWSKVHDSELPASRDVGTSAYLTRRVIDGTPYLGVGLGAQTLSPSTISYNDGAVGKSLKPYFRSVDDGRLPIQDLYVLPAVQLMAKFVAVSFYFGEIVRASFRNKFAVDVTDAFAAQVAYVVDNGLMTLSERALELTPKGACTFPGVIALFFAPSVQRHLLDKRAGAEAPLVDASPLRLLAS